MGGIGGKIIFKATGLTGSVTVSPAVGGKTTWTWATDGDLVLVIPGIEFTISNNSGSNISPIVKLWGGGTSVGSHGGYTTGVLTINNATSVKAMVGGSPMLNVAS